MCSLIEIIQTEIKQKGIEKLGVVASPTSIRIGLFNRKGTDIIAPHHSQITTIENAIAAIINGDSPARHQESIDNIINSLFGRGATHVLLGCTELELIKQDSRDKRLIKPLHLAAQKVIETIK